MEPALTPRLALSYLRELSADFRGGAVLDPALRPLAGEPGVAAAAAAVISEGGAGAPVPVPRHLVFAARSAEHAIVAVYGELALPGLVRHDLEVVLADLAGSARAGAAAAGGGAEPAEGPEAPPPAPAEPPSEALREAAEALFSAVQSRSGAPHSGSEP